MLYTIFGISANQTHSNLNNYVDHIYQNTSEAAEMPDIYSTPCLKRPLRNRKNKGLMENGSLMVESIAECSP